MSIKANAPVFSVRRWILNASAFFAMVNLIFSPIAMAAGTTAKSTETVRAKLKELGVGSSDKTATVGALLTKLSATASADELLFWQANAARYKNTKIPKFEVTDVNTSEGTQIRLSTVDPVFGPLNIQLSAQQAGSVKVNGVKYSDQDLKSVESVLAKFTADQTVNQKMRAWQNQIQAKSLKKISAKDFFDWPVTLQAAYIREMQKAVEAATVVLAAKNKQSAARDVNSGVFVAMLNSMINEAWAAKAAKADYSCVNAGWEGRWSNGKCLVDWNSIKNDKGEFLVVVDGNPKEMKSMKNPNQELCGNGGGTLCNPKLYGYDTSGKVFCQKGEAEENYATSYVNLNAGAKTCAQKSDSAWGLSQERKDSDKISLAKFVLSTVGVANAAKADISLSADGKISSVKVDGKELLPDLKVVFEKFQADYNSYIDRALVACDKGVANMKKLASKKDESNNTESERQKLACDHLPKLKFELAFVNPEPGLSLEATGAGAPVVAEPAVRSCPIDSRPRCSAEPSCLEGRWTCNVTSDLSGDDVAPVANQPTREPAAKQRGFCETSRGSNWCVPVGVTILGLFAVNRVFRLPKPPSGSQPDPYCPPGGLNCTSPIPVTSPSVPPLPAPPEGGVAVPVPPASQLR